ncbi:hypothetical protein [Gemmatimonas sp. UBA7669]|uniref:hypothetical protein n=1 Tax=Gemmatimonas sp. UBA7669 TaxID=1946568 RepID=UPI0025B9B15F|nr:hypothetical protein [Gemmatimonas sp. UBA7669]
MSVTLTIPADLNLSAEEALEVLRQHAQQQQSATKDTLWQVLSALMTKLRSREYLFSQYETELTAVEQACAAHRAEMTRLRKVEVYAIAEGNRLRQERIEKGIEQGGAGRPAGRP